MAHTPPARAARPPIVMPSAQTAPAPEAPKVAEPQRRQVTLAEAGFVAPEFITKPKGAKFKRLMLSLEGVRGSGKSEFANSAPGPIAHLILDRGIDSVIDNPDPPATRAANILYKVITVPKASQQEDFVAYWRAYYQDLMLALYSTDGRTVVIDGDPDSWELQRLAEFGRLTKVPPILYDTVNTARRALYARCYDSGKIVIATSRVREVYATKFDAAGRPEINSSGNEVRVPTGEHEKQGFNDGGYVWTIQCACLYDDEKQKFGIKIRECKVNKKLNGQELWGDSCNFETLVSMVYPHIELSEWGY